MISQSEINFLGKLTLYTLGQNMFFHHIGILFQNYVLVMQAFRSAILIFFYLQISVHPKTIAHVSDELAIKSMILYVQISWASYTHNKLLLCWPEFCTVFTTSNPVSSRLTSLIKFCSAVHVLNKAAHVSTACNLLLPHSQPVFHLHTCKKAP